MKKFPFTTAGFLALQHDLFSLSDEALTIEADLMRNCFDDWMNTHFELSATQVCFLKAIDPRAKPLLVVNTSFAIANRLLITLNKVGNSASEEQGKIIWHTSTLSACSGRNADYTASGSLTIHIAYVPSTLAQVHSRQEAELAHAELLV